MKAIERLYKYLSLKGISPNKFEKENGLSQGYLSKMHKRKADMGESILISVLENCPGLRAEWLLTGKGEMVGTDVEEIGGLDSNEVGFYKLIAEERKKEIAEKDKEIARLNKLVGRYEERLNNFPASDDVLSQSNGDMYVNDPEGISREASELPTLPLSAEIPSSELIKDKQPRPGK